MNAVYDLSALEKRARRRPRARALHSRSRLGKKADFTALQATVQDCCRAGEAFTRVAATGWVDPDSLWDDGGPEVEGWTKFTARDVDWEERRLVAGEQEIPPPLDAQSGAQTRFAINTPRLFIREAATAPTANSYGTFTEIADDLRELGVQVARHPGKLQLMLTDLVTDARGIPLDPTFSDIPGQIAVADAFTYLTDLVRHAASRDWRLELYLTLLVQGSEATEAPPGSPIVSPEPYGNPLGITWNTDHSGQTVVEDTYFTGTEPPTHAFDAWPDPTHPGEPSAWDIFTLDPTSGYKRYYYTRICRKVGEKLSEMREDLLREGIDLSEYIHSIEIGNEIEIKHTREEGGVIKADCEAWGDLYFWCAVAFRDGCDFDVPLMLPGIASYGPGDTEDCHFYNGKLYFLKGILEHIETLCLENDRELADLVAGIDYHYYHRQTGEVQSLAYLPVEVAEIRGILQKSNPEAVVCVVESSVNVICQGSSTGSSEYDSACEGAGEGNPVPYDTFAVGTPPAPDARPTQYTLALGPRLRAEPGSEAGALDFQAMSVWFRLAAAHCAGVQVAGWHCLMGDAPQEGGAGSAPFMGTGLRRDLHYDTGSPGEAAQRASWPAFRDYVSWLGGLPARLLWPDLTSYRERKVLEDDMASWPVENHVWVVEYEATYDGFYHTYYYLVFVDPFGEMDAAMITFESASSSAEEVTDLWLMRSLQPLGVEAPGGPADTFPYYLWSLEPEECVHPGDTIFQLTVARGQYPALLTTPQRLAVQRVTGPGGLVYRKRYKMPVVMDRILGP